MINYCLHRHSHVSFSFSFILAYLFKSSSPPLSPTFLPSPLSPTTFLSLSAHVLFLFYLPWKVLSASFASHSVSFCLLSHPISFLLSISVSLFPLLKRYHLLSRMSWIRSYTITMGTVTEEIMSESDRETDGWSGSGGGGTQLRLAFFWFDRTTTWENYRAAEKQGRWIDG